jgi:CheY-like chemotaxis protein/anti-sigma regulatory factor (Ser/Thr protein kinase)
VTKVLVVDADVDYRLLVRLGLQGAEGFAPVLEASDAEEAVALARSESPDVILLDVSLPAAFETVPRLAPARVVLVSSRPQDELATVAAAAGAVAYIGKDLSPTDLPAAINDVTRVVDRLEAVLARATEQLPAHLRSAGEARDLVRSTLDGWTDGDRIDDIVLCVSELVTNAVVHAASSPRVMVHVRPAVIHVEVSDASDVLPVPRDAAPADTSGRGMSILSGFSDRWGSLRRSGGGKTVWFDVARTSPRPGREP